jgi:signal transduction histidine kinase
MTNLSDLETKTRLDLLYMIAKKVGSVQQLPRLVEGITQMTQRMLNASASSVLLFDDEEQGFRFEVAEGPAGKLLRKVKIDTQRGIAGWVAHHGKPLIVNDVAGDHRFNREVDKITGFVTKSIVCAPLVIGRNVIGVIEVLNKMDGGNFSEQDLEALMSVASTTALAIENARLHQRIQTELERQSEEKTEFLHSVAHEIRTPLTAVISSSELLDETLSSTVTEEKQRIVGNITRGAWTIDNTISELLDFARMHMGKMELELEPLDLNAVAKEVTSRVLHHFENRDQTLRLEIPDSLPLVTADRDKLEHIIYNLLSNANKYSPSGGSIILRARHCDSKVVVEVEDSAPIITNEEKERIFEPYYRGEDINRKKRIPGLGLGTTVTKNLVELHGGEIWIDSKPEKGNIFAFSLLTSV